MTRKVSLRLLLLGIPVAALAALVLVLALGNGSSKKAQADFPHTGINFSISGASGKTDLCDSDGTGGLPVKCDVTVGGTFTLYWNVRAIPTGFTYAGYDSTVSLSGGLTATGALTVQGANAWPDCGIPAGGFPTPGCSEGTGATPSVFVGRMWHQDIKCGASPSVENVTLVNGAGNTDLTDPASTAHGEVGDESIAVNCRAVPPTSTSTATATAPTFPRMQKCLEGSQFGANCVSSANVFLTGHAKNTTTCLDLNGVKLEEGLSNPVASVNIKGEDQSVAAFQFEVRYDTKLVCVVLGVGQGQTNPDATCQIQDDSGNNSKGEAGKGVARIGCVTFGKDNVFDDTLPLGSILVLPQPEVFHQIKPNQDNGIPVQIINQDCNLADSQGHGITITSCEDAALTLRFLEGDVNADCVVDVSDSQNIAFRWGSSKGSLLFQSRQDLVPSGQVNGDGKIDIKDLQFVFGRVDISTCENPWPAQNPDDGKQG